MDLKIKLSKENIISLLAVLPYLEGRISYILFWKVFSPTAYFRPILGWLILLVAAFLLFNMKYNKGLPIRYYSVFIIFLVVLSFPAIAVFSRDLLSSFSTWLWFYIPILSAWLVVRYCRLLELDYEKIIKGMIFWFCLFSVVLLAYEICINKVLIDPNVRLDAHRVGGAVVFGYTTAIYFSLCICIKEHFNTKWFYMALIILTINALATGSRGAIWPIIVLWGLNCIKKPTIKKLIGLLIAFLLIVGFIFVFFRGDINEISKTGGNTFTRIFSTRNFIRANSTLNVFTVFNEFTPFEKFFGKGTGDFFPYLKWIISGGDGYNNHFLYNELEILVQPHNSFLYLLLEEGLLSLVVCTLFFFYGIVKFLWLRTGVSLYYAVFFLVVIFVNNFDSIFFVNPGTAMVHWILLMLLIELHVREYKKGRRALLATEIKSIENRAEISGLEKVYDKLSY